MLSIKLFGIQTPEYLAIRNELQHLLENGGYDFELEEVSDVQTMVDQDIESIPFVKINGTASLAYKEFDNTHLFIEAIHLTLLTFTKAYTMKKLLVPVDFSPASERALQYALHWAAHFGSSLEVVNVYMPPVDPQYGSIIGINDLEKIQSDKVKQLESLVEKWKGKIALPDNSLVSSKCLIGFPAEEIMRYAKDFDLIIIGATGEKSVLEKWMGSVSMAIAQKSNTPVLLVPENSEFKPVHQIAYAFSPDSDKSAFLTLAKHLSGSFGALIHLVHVLDKNHEEPPQSTRELLTEYFAHHEIQFDHVHADSVASGLERYLGNHPIDLLIMVAHKRPFWEKWFHPSVTKQMSFKPKIPILVYHNQEV